MVSPLILKRGLGKWFSHLLLKKGVRNEEDRIRILGSIYKRIGEPADNHLKFLGEGKYAAVGWLQSDRRKVLKITTDEDDAMALEAIRKNPAKHLVKVYDVFRITPKNKPGVFGIVTAKLTPLPKDEEGPFFYDLEEIKSRLRLPFGIGSTSDLDEYEEELDSWIEEIKEYLEWSEDPEVDEDEEFEFDQDLHYEEPDEYLIDKYEYWKPILKRLNAWNEECYERGISFHDLSPGNVMLNRHIWTLMDFGHNSHTPHARLPQLEILPKASS